MIRDKTARRTACSWHSGGGSALYVLCSTGAITDGALVETTENWDRVRSSDSAWHHEAGRLVDYVRSKGPRGPVDGWGKMRW